MIPLPLVEVMFSFFVVVSLISLMSEKDSSKSMKRIRLVAAESFAWLLMDAASYYFNTPETNYWMNVNVVHFINVSVYILSNVVLISFLLYCEAYFQERIKLSGWVFRIPILVLTCDAAIDVIYYIQGKMVVCEERYFKIIGTAPIFVMVSYMLCLMYAPILAIIKRKEIEKRTVWLFSLYAVPTCLAIFIIEMNGYDLSVLLGSFTVVVIARILQNELKNSRLCEATTFTNYFLGSFLTAYYVGLEDYSCKVYKKPDVKQDEITEINNYLEDITRLLIRQVHPDDLDELLALIQPKQMAELLKRQSELFHMFRVISNKKECFIRLRIIRGADSKHAALAFEDITEEVLEQRKRFLGNSPISDEILLKSNIGLWAVEADETGVPKMYADEAMLNLLGITEPLPPEKVYESWYNHIEKESCGFVMEAIEKMKYGHSEVQYPWRHPDGHIMIVRCGGIRNPEFKGGLRIEGTHQDVTEMIHFDEKEVKKLKKAENELHHAQLRAEVLSFLVDYDDDPINLLRRFAERLRSLFDCDQFIYRDLAENRVIANAPDIEEEWSVPMAYCSQCAHFDIKSSIYSEGFTEMNNCQNGWKGVPVYRYCPIKSSLTRVVFCDGEAVGCLSIRFLRDYHSFSETERSTLDEFSRLLSISLSRYEAKKENKELKERPHTESANE